MHNIYKKENNTCLMFEIGLKYPYGGGICEQRFRLQSVNLCSKSTPSWGLFSLISNTVVLCSKH